MKDIHLENIKRFIANFWSYKKEVTLNKTLDDLGMYGDDKRDFLVEFTKKFNINIENVDFNKYIEPEPTMLLHIDSLIRFLFNKKITSKFDVKPITIEQLVKAVETKSWVE